MILFFFMKKVVFVLFLLNTFYSIYSQNNEIENLHQSLTKVGNDTSKVIILIDMGVAFSNENPDSSLKYFSKASTLSLQLKDSKDLQIRETALFLYAECLYESAYVYSQIMKYSVAEALFNEAISELNVITDKSKNTILINKSKKLNAEIIAGMGNVYLDKSYYSIALKKFIEAMEIKNRLLKEGIIEEFEIASNYFNIGIVHYELKNYEKSLEYYNKCLLISEKADNDFGIAKCNNNIGLVKRKMNQIDDALNYFEKTAEYAKNNENQLLLAQAFDNIADCHLAKKDFKKAELYLVKSIIITRKLKNTQGEVYIMLGFAELYLKTGRYNEAVTYCLKSIELSKKISALSLEKASYEMIFAVYEKTGQYSNALNYHKKFKELEDSIFNNEKTGQIAEMEAKYQAEYKQHEIDKQKIELAQRDSQLQRKKTQTYIFSGLLILLLSMIILIYFNFRHKQAAGKIIQNQNKKITESIEYAKRIQNAAQPSEKYLNQIFSEHFIINKPLQIVSGDFYWSFKKDNFTVFSVADCTGHGVPGGFIGMLGISILNEVTGNCDLKKPDLILEEMRAIIKKSFSQKGTFDEQKDGIDISICSIDNSTNTLYFSGANQIGFHLRKGVISELKPVMNPVGIYPKEIPFSVQTMQLEDDDIIYLFTDGYTD